MHEKTTRSCPLGEDQRQRAPSSSSRVTHAPRTPPCRRGLELCRPLREASAVAAHRPMPAYAAAAVGGEAAPSESAQTIADDISSATPPNVMGSDEVVPGMLRENSTVGDLPEPGSFKKKKKKRVGGIAFAVSVEEQVIATNDEEMTLRQEHWRAIQEKANDPNHVYSNDTSRNASGSASPLRQSRSPPALTCPPDSVEIAAHAVDPEELDSKLRELANASAPSSPRGVTTDPARIAKTNTSARSNPSDHAPGNPACQQHAVTAQNSERQNEETSGLGFDSADEMNCKSTEVVTSQQADVKQDQTVQSVAVVKAESDQQKQEEEEREEKAEFLRTSHEFTNQSPAPGKKRDMASEPPSAGCPNLATPNLDAYISDKDRDELFRSMAHGLLEYIGCYPLARKAPIPPKGIDAHGNDTRSKEEKEREARLRAKGAKAREAAGRKRREEEQETEKKRKSKPLLPKDEKTAQDFGYAIKRWLERIWKANVQLRNTYHIGVLMEGDVGQLAKGTNPILESKLDTVWNGDGFEVKLVPLADVSEWDWRDLARRFKDQHLIGDKFFPSEDYSTQVGLDAMRAPREDATQMAVPPGEVIRPGQSVSEQPKLTRTDVIAREAVFWTKESEAWEDNTQTGLAADFSASTQLIRWDYTDAPPSKELSAEPKDPETANDKVNGDQTAPSQTLSEFVETSNAEWLSVPRKGSLNIHKKGSGRRSSNSIGSSQASVRSSRGNNPRSLSEPLFSQPKTVKAAPGVKMKISDDKRQRMIEEEKEFRRFIKEYTGRSHVSQRKMDECREPFRLHKLHQKRVSSVGTYGNVLKEVEQEFEIMLEDAELDGAEEDGFLTEEAKRQNALFHELYPPDVGRNTEKMEQMVKGPDALLDLSLIGKAEEKVKSKTPMSMPERLRAGFSMMNSIETSFAARCTAIGKTEVADMLQNNTNMDMSEFESLGRGAELSFDEFLRRPMKVHLARDPGLIKALRTYAAMVGETGMSELEPKPCSLPWSDPRAARGNRLPTKLPGLRASSSALGQRSHHRLSPEEMVRSKSSLDHHSLRPAWDASSFGIRSSFETTDLNSDNDANALPGGIPRRDGLRSQGAMGVSPQFSTAGIDLSRSPYAQKMATRPDNKGSKKRVIKSHKAVEAHSRFSKIGGHDMVATSILPMR